eukprot:UN13921
MASDTMIEGERSWRGRLSDIHASTSTLLESLCEKMEFKFCNAKNVLVERFGDPFGMPISVQLNENWEAIKAKFNR